MDIAFAIEPDGPATRLNRGRVFYIILDPVLCKGVAIPDDPSRDGYGVEFVFAPGSVSRQPLDYLASAPIYGPKNDQTLDEIVGPPSPQHRAPFSTRPNQDSQ